MAFPHLASSSNASAVPSYTYTITEKLANNNYPTWRLQVMSALRGAQVASYIDATTAPPEKFLKAEGDAEAKPNPDYESWFAKDQSVLCFLLGSLGTRPPYVIEDMFARQSRARVISTRMALTAITKGTSTISEYYQKVKTLADEMAAAGKKLEDEEMVSYILSGLDAEYDSVVSAVASRVEPISLGELYTQLVSFEQRMEMRGAGGQQSSANLGPKEDVVISCVEEDAAPILEMCSSMTIHS